MKSVFLFYRFILSLFITSILGFFPSKSDAEPERSKESPLQFKVRNIDGKDVNLNEYIGKVVMIVNTASRCGFTPQYQDLEEIYNKYKEKGFVILAFPSNNFLNQEPGTNEEIKQFCKINYKISFPLFEKVSVEGKDICPLYQFLTSSRNAPYHGSIKWNFTKFLIGKDGKTVARFEPNVKPNNKAVIEVIEKELSK